MVSLYSAARHLLSGSRLSLQSASGSLSLSPASATTALTCAVLLPSCAGYTLGSGLWHKGGVSRRQHSTLQTQPEPADQLESDEALQQQPKEADPPRLDRPLQRGNVRNALSHSDRPHKRRELGGFSALPGGPSPKATLGKGIGRGLGNEELLSTVMHHHFAFGAEDTQRALTELSGRMKAGRMSVPEIAESLSLLSQQLSLRMHDHSLHTLALSMASLSSLGCMTPELAHRAGTMLKGGAINVSSDTLAAFDICRLTWACARAGCGSPDLFAALTPRVITLAHLFKPSDLSRTAWAYAKCSPQGEAMRSLFDALHSGVHSLNATDIATTASAIAMAGQGSEQQGLLHALGKHALRRSAEFGPAELSKTLRALATVGMSDGPFFAAMAEQAVFHSIRFSPREAAAMVSALGSSGHTHTPLFHRLCEKAAGEMRQYSSREVVELLYGFAKVGHAGQGMDDMCTAIEKQAANLTFRPGELATLVWGAGQAKRRGIIQAVEAQLLVQAPKLSGGQVAQVLWGCGRSGYSSRRLLNALEKRAASLSGELTPQDIGNTVWALAKMGHTCRSKLLTILHTRIMESAPEFTGPSLAASLWGYAILDPSQVGVFSVLTTQVERKAAALSAAELSTAAWACGHAGYLPPRMLDMVSVSLAEPEGAVGTQWLVKAASACANLKHDTPELLEAVARRVLASPRSFMHVELAMVAEAFAAQGYEAPTVFEALQREVMLRGVSSLAATDLARTVSAMARVGHDGASLFGAIEEHAVRTVHQLSSYGLVRLLWAFAEVGFEVPSLLSAADCWLASQAQEMGRQHISPGLRKAFATHSFTPVKLLAATSVAGGHQERTYPHSDVVSGRRENLTRRADAPNKWLRQDSAEQLHYTRSVYPTEPCAVLQCHA